MITRLGLISTSPVFATITANVGESTVNKKIALALGSGSARGIAHIGVIQRLQDYGVKADIACGTSAGAVVAACYALGKLPDFAQWLKTLNSPLILRYLSINFSASGGMADATKLIDFFKSEYGNPNIEDLDIAFAAVATDLERGREVWLQTGPIWEAVRASIALPGILTPVAINQRWLIDGGLVNPVPVSLCRALGADYVLGVDLNSDLLNRPQKPQLETKIEKPPEPARAQTELLDGKPGEESPLGNALSKFSQSVLGLTNGQRKQGATEPHKPAPPNTLGVIMNAINIMQDRITRSRLAGEPADVMLWPRLGNIGLLEFDRAEEALAGGRDAVDRMLPAIQHSLAAEGIQLTLKPAEATAKSLELAE